MAENITYPAYDAMLAGTSVLNTWSDGTQFSIGNTTYAWDPTPGLWRAFTTATSSSGEAGTAPVGALAGLSNHTVLTLTNNQTFTNDTGTTLYGKIGGLAPSRLQGSIQITGAGAWGYRGPYRDQGQRGGGLAPAFVRAIDDTAVALPVSGGSNTDDPFGWDGELFLPPGATIRPVNNVSFTFWYGSVVGATGGATVNIGGGGGLQLGEFFSQTVTASTTSLTLDHTGPAWVFLTAGSGSGAVRVNTNPDDGRTGRGGNGGSGGFFLQDVSVLEGANVVIGTGGTGVVITRQPNQERVGVSGTGSSMTWSGITLTCTAGAAAGIISNGADGTATIAGTDAPTLLTNAEVTTEAEAYWRDFVVASTGGNLQLGSGAVSVPVTTGSAGDYTQTTAGTTAQASSVAGSAGQLYIVYQNQ